MVDKNCLNFYRYGWGDVEQRHMTPRTDLASLGVNLPRQETLGISMPSVVDLCKGRSGNHIVPRNYEVDDDRTINIAVCGAKTIECFKMRTPIHIF